MSRFAYGGWLSLPTPGERDADTLCAQTVFLSHPQNMHPNDARFIYRGCSFICSVEQISPNLFQPHVLYEHGLPLVEQMPLPSDTEPYGSAAEAHRHAQQQAMRWVHDRTGDGQGQF